MPTREHDNDQPGSPWSRTSVQLSALFLGVLLVIGIAIAIFHHGSSSNNPAANHAEGAQAPTAGTRTGAAAGPCSLAAGNQQVPSASYPQGTTWQPVGSMDVPQSPTLGPQHVQNGINVCFAHSPGGALLAAMNFLGEGSTNISERQVVEELSVDVPTGVTTAPAANDWEQGIQIAGYKYDSYTAANAVLEVALRHAEGGLTAVQVPMRWTGNDWKYVFPPDGPISTTLNGTEVQAPYVAWSSFQ